MTRSQRQSQIAAYADGELSGADAARLEKFLAEQPELLAAVETQRSIRAAAHRDFASVAVPAGLREHVVAQIGGERRAARSQRWRLFSAAGFAAAAVVMLTANLVGDDFWARGWIAPVPAALQPLSADDLVAIFEGCDDEGVHDEFRVAGKSVVNANQLLGPLGLFPKVGMHLPNLDAQQFALAGVCRCGPANDLNGLHAAYVRAADHRHVSLFLLGKSVQLTTGGAPVAQYESPKRKYQVAALRDDVVVVKWTERHTSIVLCAKLPAGELVALADGFDPFTARSSGLAAACLSLLP